MKNFGNQYSIFHEVLLLKLCLRISNQLRTGFAEGFILSIGIDMSLESKNIYQLILILWYNSTFFKFTNSNNFCVLITRQKITSHAKNWFKRFKNIYTKITQNFRQTSQSIPNLVSGFNGFFFCLNQHNRKFACLCVYAHAHVCACYVDFIFSLQMEPVIWNFKGLELG